MRKLYNTWKTSKKLLTSVIESGILAKLSERATSSVEGPKKLKKSFAKPLDKAAAKWYNKQAVDRKVTVIAHWKLNNNKMY